MKIKVLLVMPKHEVQTVKIPRSSQFIKALIGKELLKIRLDKNIMIIADKNANLTEFNRIIEGNIILGTFIIVSTKNRHRVSMTKREIRKYTNMFKWRKHKKKINSYKSEYLQDYFANQGNIKQKNIKENIEENLKKVS